jgi:LysR family transcriptional regulator, carnitine catabolism transcriptional activator
MQLEDIRYFVDSATQCSLAKAAKLNRVSAPAISQAIRRLEASLGCELLVHRKNRFKLTEAGESLLRQSQPLLRSFEELRGVVRARSGTVSGRLNLATSHSIALSILPDCLHAFGRRYPALQPNVRLGGTPLIRSWIEARDVECGLTLDDGKLGGLSRIPMFGGVFRAVFPKQIGEKDILKLGFLTTASRPEVDALQNYVQKHFGVEFPQRMVVDSWEVVKRMTRLGLGVGLLPDFLLHEQSHQRRLVSVLDDLPKLSYEFCLVIEDKEMLSTNARLFVDFAKTYVQRLIRYK